jgi:hypothetical protein
VRWKVFSMLPAMSSSYTLRGSSREVVSDIDGETDRRVRVEPTQCMTSRANFTYTRDMLLPTTLLTPTTACAVSTWRMTFCRLVC